MIPTRASAMVWHTSDRRYLTLPAACRHEALLAAHAKYPCECETETGFNCDAHEYIEGDPAGFAKLVDRYARLLVRAARRGALAAGKGT
ncbi:unnamed protein product [marine sediment metagenome]|uniref:Uncharacterized protein n=1 Tax=marine sediment metagenome TaxID=412755 RepID=X0Y6X5_9ZZZZ